MLLTSAPTAGQIYERVRYNHFFFDGKPNLADHEHVAALAAELGVGYIDLVALLKRNGKGLYLRGDGHWTPKGHRVVAEAVCPRLRAALGAE